MVNTGIQCFVEENNFIQVKNDGRIYNSCVRSIARIIGAMRVPMRARAIHALNDKDCNILLAVLQHFVQTDVQ